MIAAAIDRNTQGTFRATQQDITAPAGLVAGGSVIDDATRQPILHVFELDYRRRLDATEKESRPPVSPGAFRAAKYAIAATGLLLFFSVFSRAKGFKAKLQLLYALAAVSILILAAVLAIVAWLTAAGVLNHNALNWTGLGPKTATLATGASTLVGWTATRRRLLAAATTIQRLMRYMMDARFRDTVAQTLDDAVDGLRDNGWTGPVHVVAYSFGSLVAIDSLLPLDGGLSPNRRVTETVASLTTIGCPVDAVRLLLPWHFNDPRNQRLDATSPWYNVYNAADVFATNFSDGAHPDHGSTGAASPSASDRTVKAVRDKYIRVAARSPEPIRYGPDKLRFLSIFAVGGFRAHDGYWGRAEEASCFSLELVEHWVPARVKTAKQQVPAP